MVRDWLLIFSEQDLSWEMNTEIGQLITPPALPPHAKDLFDIPLYIASFIGHRCLSLATLLTSSCPKSQNMLRSQTTSLPPTVEAYSEIWCMADLHSNLLSRLPNKVLYIAAIYTFTNSNMEGALLSSKRDHNSQECQFRK